jgi:hypothetical protein|tara:strand:+ start:184 stop:522 length:339 start_codon:yes stop_codon:yes gene_type:complete
MNIKGRLTQKLTVESGTSKAGKEWKKQNIVVDTGSQFNPLVCISFFGDEKIKMLDKYKEGQEVEVSINVSSREFDSKWYHNIDGWKINEATAVAEPQGLNESETEDNSNLPF